MDARQLSLFSGLMLSLAMHGLVLLAPLPPFEGKPQDSIHGALRATIRSGSTQTAGVMSTRAERSIKNLTPPRNQRLLEQTSAATILSRRDPLYYTPDQVELTAEIQQLPELPFFTNEEKQQGRVRLRIFVNESGAADRVEIEEMTPSTAYGDAIAATFMGNRYKAATLNSKRVKSWLQIEISYGE